MQAAHKRHWEAFVSFCEVDLAVPIPTNLATVACYLGFLFDKGTIRGGYIRPYIAAIGAQHLLCGLSGPTADPLVSSTNRGYVANDASRRKGAPLRSAPLLSTVVLRALHQALSSTNMELLRRSEVLVVGSLIYYQPTAISYL